jgi:glycerophosphoryl diester phosphodiesterase
LTLTKEWLERFGWPVTLLTGHPLSIAHRGASDYAPENTHKSFQIAADLCSEMWEIDVHLSADGVCVVSHDNDLFRVSGQKVCISQSSWSEISTVQLPEGQRVPRLEEVIVLAKTSGCGLYIEIKGQGAGLVAWKRLQEANFKFACLGSFVVEWIAELREMSCEYPLSVLVPANVDPLDYLNGVSVDILHICWRKASDHPDELLTDHLMQRLNDYQIVLWDEDRVSVLAGLWDKPVMGICSNRPELLKPYKPDADHPIDLVCHRGANNVAPENTLDAARICIEQRFQYIELDVRTTSDGALVVIHDADVNRTTDGNGLVIDQTFADIRVLDAGGWFRDGTAGLQVPTLSEFLALARNKSGIYVEIKHADVENLLAIIASQEMSENCFFWGADSSVLRELRDKSADITLMAPRWIYSSVAEAVADYGAQIIEFDVEQDDLSEISQCEALGVRSMIYSRHSDWSELEGYLKYKPDLINLDYPDRMKILISYPLVHQHFQAMSKAFY